MWRIEFFNMHGRLIGTFITPIVSILDAKVWAYSELLSLHNSTGIPDLKVFVKDISKENIYNYP